VHTLAPRPCTDPPLPSLPNPLHHPSGVHNSQSEYSLTSLTGEQKLNGTRAAPQKYLQHGDAGVGQAMALAEGPDGQLVVVKHEQALETRVGPHVATGVGMETVLEGIMAVSSPA